MNLCLKKEIQRVYDENHQVYGVRKVWRQLLREGIRVAESANGITRQQAEDEMQLFKKVFTVVRLLDGEHLEQMHKRCKLDCKDEKEK